MRKYLLILPLIAILAMVALNVLSARQIKEIKVSKPQNLCDAAVANCSVAPKGVCVKGGQCTVSAG